MSVVEAVHESFVFSRRVECLARHFVDAVPEDAKVLDIGTGNGQFAARLMALRPDVEIVGIDVLVRPETAIEVSEFDGHTMPFPADSFDVAMFVDVLHHTEDPAELLAEAARVASRAIVLKDHLLEGLLAGPTLRLMDWVGNASHGVALPYNYWSRERWAQAFTAIGAEVGHWREDLGLYPWPLRWVFERSLHFVARLDLGR